MELPASGHPLHTRMLEIALLQRDDGQLDARGAVVDLRKSGFVPMAGEFQNAGFIHDMRIDAVVDPATSRIESLEARQNAVAFEASEATRGESCRDPVPRLQALVGTRLDGDYAARLREAFGGPRGCSHLLILAQAFGRAIPAALAHERELGGARKTGERLFKRSLFVDGLAPPHNGEGQGEIGIGLQLCDVHTQPRSTMQTPLDRLDTQSELRAWARVNLDRIEFTELSARERVRGAADIATAEWSDHEARIADLVGRRVFPGLGGELLRRFGEDRDTRLLLDALLHLAPGFVQCMPALADRWLSERKSSSGDSGSGAGIPNYVSTGGGADACYMWRRDSALLQIRSDTKPSTEESPA